MDYFRGVGFRLLVMLRKVLRRSSSGMLTPWLFAARSISTFSASSTRICRTMFRLRFSEPLRLVIDHPSKLCDEPPRLSLHPQASESRATSRLCAGIRKQLCARAKAAYSAHGCAPKMSILPMVCAQRCRSCPWFVPKAVDLHMVVSQSCLKLGTRLCPEVWFRAKAAHVVVL